MRGMEYKRNNWKTPSRGEFNFDEMVNAIKEHILEDTTQKYIVIVGGDSQTFYSKGQTKYITTVIVRKVGRGAQYYYFTDYKPFARSLREKIWNEVMSIYETIIALKDSGLSKNIVDVVPHIDVGEKGETRKLIKEVTGLFIGEGYNVQIKPFSFASSSVADKHSK